MLERPATTPDTLSPKFLDPTDLGSAAIAATAELPKSPEIDVEQLECERKKNTAENLRMLQNRFGERFVKGNLMEGGGYTGGAARELLAGFMDKPGFANELKRLIPSKRSALRLLNDNQVYIQATLEQLYKEDLARETGPIKDPYELANSVGYELTGPFESTGAFVPYDKQDFRPNEHLCTFNNPVERLAAQNILWLRHSEVAETLPADQLTADNLSNAWKTYLRTIGRYDRGSDTYDLTDLLPNRDDPYGTSSMSVQISREGTQVSIKNRYNHTVGNPDNTLYSNLDNVAFGLRHAIYSQVGREDLMDKTNVALAENYVADNDGGIHVYWYEENNIYYGNYEYIENGVVTTIDRSKYLMISPQLYAPISQKGEEINLRPKVVSGIEIALGEDRQFLDTAVKLENGTLDEGDEDDKVFIEAFYETNLLAIQLRQMYVERDRVELALLMSETLINQAKVAHDVYQTMSERLGVSETMTEEGFTQLIERKVAGWHQNGTVDHLVYELIDHNSQPRLIATPNVLADSRRIEELMGSFEKDQIQMSGWVERDTDFAEMYSAEELSGKLIDGPLRLSIITSTSAMECGTVDELKEQLRAMQAAQPNLNLRVPSVLEAVSYWQTLRASGIRAYRSTVIRHFDLPARSHTSLEPSVLTQDRMTLKASGVSEWSSAGQLAVG